MQDIELKPCPFCGGEAKVKATVKSDSRLTIWCECTKCNAKTLGYRPNISDEDFTMDFIEEATKRAVEKWNQRVDDK